MRVHVCLLCVKAGAGVQGSLISHFSLQMFLLSETNKNRGGPPSLTFSRIPALVSREFIRTPAQDSKCIQCYFK